MGKVSSPWCCKPCLFFTDRKSRLDKHLQTFSHQSRSQDPKTIYFCSFCTYVSPKIKSVQRHEQKVHQKQSVSIESFVNNQGEKEVDDSDKIKGPVSIEIDSQAKDVSKIVKSNDLLKPISIQDKKEVEESARIAEQVMEEFQKNEAKEAADSLLLFSHSAWLVDFRNHYKTKAK